MISNNDVKIARRFNALSHPRRARIFRLLSEYPAAGQSFGRLVQETGFAASALIHHLREMERCGLIRRKRKGVEVSYFLTTAPLAQTISAVLGQCRDGFGGQHRAA